MSQLAGQQQYRPLAEQAMLAHQSAKLIEQQGQRLEKPESKARGEIMERESSAGHRERKQQGKRQDRPASPPAGKPAHPFKGKHIDITW